MSVSYPCESQYSNDEIHIPYIRKSYKTINYEISDVLEEKIDYTLLDTCPKAIMDKLKNAANNDIKVIYEKLGVGDVYAITMTTGTMKDVNNIAETIKNSKNSYNITISSNYLNGVRSWGTDSPPTDLSIATTITHEIIHAYLLSVVDGYNVDSTNENTPFPALYDAYEKKKTTAGSQADVYAQHEIIANKFVNIIASTVQEFHTGESINSGYPMQAYLDLAWAGLVGTSIYKRNYPNDQNHKNYAARGRIENRIVAETYNSSRGDQNPLGKPCK
jgi:hypothetical protein